MSTIYCMGELLLDFKPEQGGMAFKGNAGGAPANVCVQAARLGQDGVYLSRVGKDDFGDYLKEVLAACRVDCSRIIQTEAYDTSCSFVTLNKCGDREFKFYRSNAADLHYPAGAFEDISFKRGDVFEFGSVCLKTKSSCETHMKLIRRARAAGAFVAFDPNLRPGLWQDLRKLKQTVLKFAAEADMVKVSSEEWGELSSGSGPDVHPKPYPEFFGPHVSVLLVTYGRYGAEAYIRDGRVFKCPGYMVHAVDSTGAGDSFFGAFLSGIMDAQALPVNMDLPYQDILDFACKAAAYSCTGYGGIPSMGDRETILAAIQ